jgi:D-3-phosphoglycerate dehydrogenase / 2-oxoglutarate reductase
MNPYKIVFSDYYYPDIHQELEILRKLGNIEIIDGMKIIPGGIKAEDELLRNGGDADALIVQFAPITRRVIEGLRKCRIISRYAIGVDNIDVAAAHEKGIVVANVPDYCIEEVSDTAIAHMFNCVRKVSLADDLLKRGEWSYSKIKPVRRFSSLSIGLVAFGNIARRVAHKLQPFGNPIMAYDPYFKDQDKFPWVEFLTLEEMLPRTDILSIHAPLNNETHHLINRERLALLKPGAIVVNTSRGGLMDEVALLDAIQTGPVSGAGLDVLEFPDADYDQSVLMQVPDKVVINPHMGWYSEEAVLDLQRKVALNVYQMLTTGKPLYQV